MSEQQQLFSKRVERSEGVRGIQSMTGYGRATKQTSSGSISVELRGTNHRYLELDYRLPNGLSALQERLTEMLKAKVRRGHIDVIVAMRGESASHRRIAFDEELLRRYFDSLVDLKKKFGLKGPVTLEHLLSVPQALNVWDEHVPAGRLWGSLRQPVEKALQELVRTRRREGARLVADVCGQVRLIQRHIHAVKQRLPKVLERQRSRLKDRLKELLGSGSSAATAQIEQQAASLAKDADIHEEIVRLESHLAYVQQTLSRDGSIGKQLDFIAQELMREANTMAAKVDDSQAAQHVVQIKGCIEKIREQVQNIE